MSWNISVIGIPEKVEQVIEDATVEFTGDSLAEYQAAKPHLLGLIHENFDNSEPPTPARLVLHLEASGSGWSKGGKDMGRSLTVKLERWYSRIAV